MAALGKPVVPEVYWMLTGWPADRVRSIASSRLGGTASAIRHKSCQVMPPAGAFPSSRHHPAAVRKAVGVEIAGGRVFQFGADLLKHRVIVGRFETVDRKRALASHCSRT